MRDETMRLAASLEAERLLADRKDLEGRRVAAIAHYFSPILEKLNEEIYPQGRSTPLEHSLKVLRKWQQSSYGQGLIERSLRMK